MTDAIITAAISAGCGRQRIIDAARMARIDPLAAAAAVWIAVADPEHDIDGSPMLPNQREARERDLVRWAVQRAAALGDAAQGVGGTEVGLLGDHQVVTIGDHYVPPAPRARAWNDGRVSQRTARRWQARRRAALAAGQQPLARSGAWVASRGGVTA